MALLKSMALLKGLKQIVKLLSAKVINRNEGIRIKERQQKITLNFYNKFNISCNQSNLNI